MSSRFLSFADCDPFVFYRVRDETRSRFDSPSIDCTSNVSSVVVRVLLEWAGRPPPLGPSPHKRWGFDRAS